MFTSTVATMIGSNLILNMLASVSLSYLWSYVNSLQLIANLPLFGLNIPANMLYVFSLISGSLEFNFLFTGTTTALLFGMTQEEVNARPALNYYFNTFGYGNDLAVFNL